MGICLGKTSIRLLWDDGISDDNCTEFESRDVSDEKNPCLDRYVYIREPEKVDGCGGEEIDKMLHFGRIKT